MSSSAAERVVMRRADGNRSACWSSTTKSVLAEMVSMALRYEGWNIATAADGAAAIAAARAERPDVVVLDVMLPDMSGLDVLRRLREQHPHLPVLLLTARTPSGGPDRRVDRRRRRLRHQAVLHRGGRAAAAGAVAPHRVTTVDSGAQIVVGDLVLDEDSHGVTRAGEPVVLTSTEFELLRFMMRNPKRCCPRPRSWTGSGATTSAAGPTSSSSTSRICARRSTAGTNR